jgi:hypothetical protein
MVARGVGGVVEGAPGTGVLQYPRGAKVATVAPDVCGGWGCEGKRRAVPGPCPRRSKREEIFFLILA